MILFSTTSPKLISLNTYLLNLLDYKFISFYPLPPDSIKIYCSYLFVSHFSIFDQINRFYTHIYIHFLPISKSTKNNNFSSS